MTIKMIKAAVKCGDRLLHQCPTPPMSRESDWRNSVQEATNMSYFDFHGRDNYLISELLTPPF